MQDALVASKHPIGQRSAGQAKSGNGLAQHVVKGNDQTAPVYDDVGLLEAGYSGIVSMIDNVFAILKGGAFYEPFLDAFTGALHLTSQGRWPLLDSVRYILSSGALPPLVSPLDMLAGLCVPCLSPFHFYNARKRNNHEQTGF